MISRRPFQLCGPLLLGLTLCVAGGCSQGPQADYSKLGLVEVSGTVTLDGEPLPQAAIFFVNEADNTHSYGVTDAQGYYSMMLNNQKSGVIPGTKRVEIATSKNPLGDAVGAGAEMMEVEEDPDAAPKRNKNEKVPACYNDRSKLKLEITAGDSAVDFQLKSDCSTTTAE